MSYCSQTDLERRYGAGDLKAWTDDSATGAIVAAVVTEAIAQADGLINGAAGQHYSTPLTLGNTGTAAVVKLHACRIAGYLLASRRGVVPENVRQQFEDAQEWLRQLAAGKVAMIGESATAVTRPAGGVIVAGGSAVIDRTTMDGL